MRIGVKAILIGALLVLTAGPAGAWTHWVGYKAGFPAIFGGKQPAEESSAAVFPLQSEGKSYTQIVCGTADGHIVRLQIDLADGSMSQTDEGAYPNPVKSSPATVINPLNPAWPGQVPLAFGYGADITNSVPGGVAVQILNPVGQTGSRLTGFSWARDNYDLWGGPNLAPPNGIPDPTMASAAVFEINPTGFVGPEQTLPAMLTPVGDPNGQVNDETASDPNNYYLLIGGADHRVKVRHLADGTDYNANWPFYTQDSVWSTPVAYDLTGDGRPEIIGTSDLTEGSFLSDGRPTWAGGRLFALDIDTVQLVWEVQTDQVMYSSPVIGDVNGDGSVETVCGSGPYYQRDAYYVYCVDAQGNALPGWPVGLPKPVRNSPALADLNNDGKLEVIVGCDDGKVYCLNYDGTVRWSTVLIDRDGVRGDEYSDGLVRTNPAVADIDGDGDLEILVSWLFEVIVLDHNGVQLTGPGDPAGRIFLTYWSLFGSPAVYDIDADGYMDLVVAGANMGDMAFYAWPLTAPNTAKAPWPQYRVDYANRGVYLGERAYRLVSR